MRNISLQSVDSSSSKYTGYCNALAVVEYPRSLKETFEQVLIGLRGGVS